MQPGLHDVAEFLRAHAPFDAMSEDAVRALAAAARIGFYPAGAEPAVPPGAFGVVRSGAIELLDGERMVDLLGPGELLLPGALLARAHEDSLCYELPGDIARPLLARPEGLRFVARAMVSPLGEAPAPALAGTPVGALLRGPALTCAPDESIRAVAERMTVAGEGAIVVELGGGELGLLTDARLRERVIAGPLSPDDPVAAAMHAPALVVDPERRGSDVLLELLDRGLRHAPVRAADGRVLGVLRAGELLAAQTRTPFHVRDAIARAHTLDELRAAAAGLRPTALALADAGVHAEQIGAVIAIITDALQRWLLEDAERALEPPPGAYDWLAAGSMARREPALSSDLDACVAWEDPAVAEQVARLTAHVLDGLRACGLALDPHGVPARLLGDWRDRQALALVLDARSLRRDRGLLDALARELVTAPETLAALRDAAVARRPPTGFFRDAILGPDGERVEALDLKRDGLAPVVAIARWAGAVAGMTAGGTRERLRAGRDAGALGADDGRALEEAFDLLSELALSHQAEQLRAGLEPEDRVDPARLNRLTRSYLRDAFRAIEQAQRRIAGS